MLCPVCRTGTMSETRPYVWSCSLCGNTEFKPREDSSYARSEDTSTSSSYTNSYDTGSSYTSSYDTSSSYGTQDYSYSGLGSSRKYNSKKRNAADNLAPIFGAIVGFIIYLLRGSRVVLCSSLVFLIAIFFWDTVGGFFGKFVAVMFFLLCFIILFYM